MKTTGINQRRIPITVMALLLFAGCSTAPPKPVLREPLVLKAADLTIELTFLSEDVLVDRHGRNDARLYRNPYYGYPALITKKRLLVFDMNADTTESTIDFELKNIKLTINRVGGTAKSRQYLDQIWDHYPATAKRHMDDIMKKTILERKFTVSPGQPASGYLVFGANYPESGGEGTISMFVTTPDGDQGTLEIPIMFTTDGELTTDSANSGIFADGE